MGNVHMEATQINYRGGSVKKSVEEAIKEAIELTPEQKTNINKIPTIEAAVATKAAQSIIAPEFDSEAGVYAIGDLVMYEGKLYEFTSAHETPGDWDSTEVSEKTVADEVDSLKSGLNNVSGTVMANSLGSQVDISSYTSDDNLYTCPYDGYACLNSTTATSGTGKLTIYGNDSLSVNFGVALNANGAWEGAAVFVKKGMRIKVTALPTDFVALFEPLTH